MQFKYEEAFSLALFEIYEKDLEKQALFDEIIKVQKVFQETKVLDLFLKDPSFPFKFKKSELQRFFKDFNPFLVNAIIILVQEKRVNGLYRVLKAAISTFSDHFNILEGVIYTTELLSSEQLSKFEHLLSNHLQKRVILKNLINKELIAGYEILVGDFKLVNNLNAWVDNFKVAAIK